ncbi:HAD hydrolase-like protein [Kiloniella laminariae]|uniref:phosphoglycolate phosphatase n=1 Tax=Kiloniella laminariae TaxID=454162 RepID=A0ABT4LML6_9PROT|nr:HAD hydrolase-like protein [Kiloniella laminariae]MCZ4282332.1 HAD hydrolase-like protein [Kiloniella laminariae]
MQQILTTIFLDLDGTLIESVGIKDRAFHELFSDMPEFLPAIMDYHLSHNATVRFDKFKYIYKNILKTNLSPEAEENLATRFSKIVVNKILATENTPGADAFLNYFVDRVQLVLISVTPDQELEKIVQGRGLSNYFHTVYGASWKKDDAMRHFMELNNVKSESCAFVGDTAEDYSYAQKVSIQFVGRDSGKTFPQKPDHLYKDMNDITILLQKKYDLEARQAEK